MIEGFFKTIKHRFGLDCFGQKTRLGIYRWLMLSLVAYLLAHWVSRTFPNWWRLDWGEVCVTAAVTLLPHVVWVKLLRQIHKHRDLVDEQGVEIIIKSISSAY